jgi:hypothetical protein
VGEKVKRNDNSRESIFLFTFFWLAASVVHYLSIISSRHIDYSKIPAKKYFFENSKMALNNCF